MYFRFALHVMYATICPKYLAFYGRLIVVIMLKLSFLNKTNTSFSEVLRVTKYIYKEINASVKPWNEDLE